MTGLAVFSVSVLSTKCSKEEKHKNTTSVKHICYRFALKSSVMPKLRKCRLKPTLTDKDS